MTKSAIKAHPLARLISTLPSASKKKLLAIVGLSILAAFAEMASIGMLYPFISAITSSGSAQKVLPQRYSLEAIGDISLTALDLTILFVLSAILSAGLRGALTLFASKIIFGIGREHSKAIFENHLRRPYQEQVESNSSIAISMLAKSDVFIHCLYHALLSASSLSVATIILVALIALNPLLATSSALVAAAIYYVLAKSLKKRLKDNSSTINTIYRTRIKTVQEALGSIRDVILDKSHHLAEKEFEDQERKLRNAQASNGIIGPLPRYIIEAAALSAIAVASFAISGDGKFSAETVPVIAVLAMAVQRLLPQLQQIYQGWAYVKGNEHLLSELLCASVENRISPPPVFEKKIYKFREAIEFKNVSFSYSTQNGQMEILSSISLTIKKGEVIGIVGPSGSGKSTFIDLLLGLLKPTFGEIYIDSRLLHAEMTAEHWQTCLAHVPQSPYIFDSTIEYNVTRGALNVDTREYAAVMNLVELDNLIFNDGQMHLRAVGERGGQLSGGQRQRIAIARSLYRRPKILILDEATSALDELSEQRVMNNIYNKLSGSTLIIITHRPTTLARCDNVYELSNGKIRKVTSAPALRQV